MSTKRPAAAEKAQELMLRHGIELASVAASRHQPLRVDEHIVSGKADPWRRMLAGAVARSASGRVVCQTDWQGPRNHGRLLFYGPAGTVGAMVAVYRYLELQLTVISAAATANRAVRHVHGRTWRTSFLLGAVGRLSDRLDARQDASTHRSVDDSRALVLLTTAVDREIERRHPHRSSPAAIGRLSTATRTRPADRPHRPSTSATGTCATTPAGCRPPRSRRHDRGTPD
jgi:hypothetical protein